MIATQRDKVREINSRACFDGLIGFRNPLERLKDRFADFDTLDGVAPGGPADRGQALFLVFARGKLRPSFKCVFHRLQIPGATMPHAPRIQFAGARCHIISRGAVAVAVHGYPRATKDIMKRLQIMSDLSRACQELGQAKRIVKVNDISDGNVTSNYINRSETT